MVPGMEIVALATALAGLMTDHGGHVRHRAREREPGRCEDHSYKGHVEVGSCVCK